VNTVSTAYFFGAGCSFGTLEHHKRRYPPIGADFGSQLAERLGENLEKQYPTLAQVAGHLGRPLQDIGLEELWTCIDYHAKFQAAFRTMWEPRGKVISELKSALLLLYGSTCASVAKNLCLQEKYTLSEIIQSVIAGDTLVSFNYDTVVEWLCHKAGKRLFHRSAPDATVIRFAKPHGSASWNLQPYERSNRIVELDGEPLREPLDYNDAKMRKVDPLVLGAVPLKSELISEVQERYGSRRVYDVILSQWRAVADSIRDADRLVVLGYSFPAEDTYGRFFYQEAMSERRQRGRAELQVEYYAKCEHKGSIACAILSALPGVSSVRFRGKVEPAPE
jgi:hypothetical protein